MIALTPWERMCLNLTSVGPLVKGEWAFMGLVIRQMCENFGWTEGDFEFQCPPIGLIRPSHAQAILWAPVRPVLVEVTEIGRQISAHDVHRLKFRMRETSVEVALQFGPNLKVYFCGPPLGQSAVEVADIDLDERSEVGMSLGPLLSRADYSLEALRQWCAAQHQRRQMQAALEGRIAQLFAGGGRLWREIVGRALIDDGYPAADVMARLLELELRLVADAAWAKAS